MLASFDSVEGLPCSYGGVQGSIQLAYDHRDGCSSPANMPAGSFICELGTVAAGELRSIGLLTYDPPPFDSVDTVTMTASNAQST